MFAVQRNELACCKWIMLLRDNLNITKEFLENDHLLSSKQSSGTEINHNLDIPYLTLTL